MGGSTGASGWMNGGSGPSGNEKLAADARAAERNCAITWADQSVPTKSVHNQHAVSRHHGKLRMEH